MHAVFARNRLKAIHEFMCEESGYVGRFAEAHRAEQRQDVRCQAADHATDCVLIDGRTVYGRNRQASMTIAVMDTPNSITAAAILHDQFAICGMVSGRCISMFSKQGMSE